MNPALLIKSFGATGYWGYVRLAACLSWNSKSLSQRKSNWSGWSEAGYIFLKYSFNEIYRATQGILTSGPILPPFSYLTPILQKSLWMRETLFVPVTSSSFHFKLKWLHLGFGQLINHIYHHFVEFFKNTWSVLDSAWRGQKKHHLFTGEGGPRPVVGEQISW